MEHLSFSPEVIAATARRAATILHIKKLFFIDLLWFTAQNIKFGLYLVYIQAVNDEVPCMF